jgi:hypothetical protein
MQQQAFNAALRGIGRGTPVTEGEPSPIILQIAKQQTPPIAQRDLIKHLLEQQKMVVGFKYYLVSFRWWQLWKQWVQFDEKDEDKLLPEGYGQRPGMIDNSELLAPEDEQQQTEEMSSEDLAQEQKAKESQVTEDDSEDSDDEDSDGEEEGEEVVLRHGLVANVDYVLLPYFAWVLIYGWYGCKPVIMRHVITVGLFQKLHVELHPIVLNFYRQAMHAKTCNPATDEHLVGRFNRTAMLKDVRRFVAGVWMVPPHKTTLFFARRQKCEVA